MELVREEPLLREINGGSQHQLEACVSYIDATTVGCGSLFVEVTLRVILLFSAVLVMCFSCSSY